MDGKREVWFPHTLRVVLVLTCLTMVSAKDLSNCKNKEKSTIVRRRGTWARRPVGGPSWPTGV